MKNFIVLSCLLSTTVFFAKDRLESYADALAIDKEKGEPYMANFPRTKAYKLPVSFAVKNDKLADRYSSGEHFPLLLVLDSRDVLGKTGYTKDSPLTYIAHLNIFLK